MSANIRCYDPSTGAITLDLSSNLARIIKTIELKPYEKGVYEYKGNGQIFGFYQDLADSLNINTLTEIETNRLRIVGNSLHYHNSYSPCLLMIGVINER